MLSSSKDTSKVNILMVDDRWENLISLSAVLDIPEYNLIKASSGREALKHLLDHEFALILLDVQMPILDGFETAALIKERERTRSIPIIFVTALSTQEPFVYKGYGAGAVDYICKPFDPGILRSKVAVFADLFRKNRQLQEQARMLREAEFKKFEVESLRRERAANQKYRALVDGINNGLVWMAEPKSLAPSFLSHQIKALLGYSADDWVHNPSFWMKALHPDDLEKTLTMFRGLSAENGQMSVEHRMLGARGQEIWMQTRAQFVAGSRDGEGELQGLSVDITHLKNTERALQDSEDRFRFLATASSLVGESLDYKSTVKLIAGVAVPVLGDCCFFDLLSETGQIVRGSWAHRDPLMAERMELFKPLPEFYHNHPASQALAQSRSILVQDLDRTWVEESGLSAGFAQLIADLGARSLLSVPLIAHERKLGAVTFCHDGSGRTFSPLDLLFAEELARRFAMAIDNARLYRDAQEAIDIRDEFLSTASHELKTPLTPLKLQLQYLMRYCEMTELPESLTREIRRSLETSDRQVARINRLIDELLDVSRINHGERLVLEPEKLNLAEVLSEVIHRFSDPLERAHCKVTLNAEKQVIGEWDRLRIEQVLVNLFSNAARYAPGRPIHVSLSGDEATAQLTVRDEGSGIAEADHDRVFQRFERASSCAHGKGLGLGLYIVKKIVEAHGGRIRLDSRIGEGAAFTLELPLVAPNALSSVGLRREPIPLAYAAP